MGADLSIEGVAAQVRANETVHSLRYQHLDQSIADLKRQVEKEGKDCRDQLAAAHAINNARFNLISSRMYASLMALIGTLLATVGGLALLVVQFIQQKP